MHAIKAYPDILIPIYNANDYLVLCLHSILQYTPKIVRVILVDDASTDPEIEKTIEEFRSTWKNLVTISNKKNLGYTKSVNQILQKANNHTIILNSDVEVSDNWYKNLINCMSSCENVATITPFFDNSGAFSFPSITDRSYVDDPHERNIRQHYLDKLKLEKYPTIPTGHGSCMLITMQAIAQVNCFDEIRFPVGYGSEVDFCQKLSKLGLFHYLDYKTIIYHRDAGSHGVDKPDLLLVSNKIISDLYPSYFQKVDLFSRDGIIDLIRNSFNKQRSFININDSGSDEEKPSILIVIPDSKGGIQMTTHFLSKHLAIHFNCYILMTEIHRPEILVSPV